MGKEFKRNSSEFFQAEEHLEFFDNLTIRKPEVSASIYCLTLLLWPEILRFLVGASMESLVKLIF